jgi:predicted Zn-dependent peptidase
MVLGGYFGSRLMQEIREEKGLTYGIGSYFRPAMDGRSWIISGEMNSENADLALSCVVEIMEKLRSEIIDIEELERAKRYYSGQFRSGFDGPFSSAAKIQQRIMRNYSDTFYKDTLSAIWNTTPEEILEVAQNYLDPNTFIKVMSGKVN